MYCPTCGKRVIERAKFCGSCGHKLNEQDSKQNIPAKQDVPTTGSADAKKKGSAVGKLVLLVIVIFFVGAILISLQTPPGGSQNVQENSVADQQLEVARSRARDTKRIASIAQLQVAVELYYEDHDGVYPTELSVSTIGGYISDIPTDPLTGESYGYIYGPATKPNIYGILAELEQPATALNKDADLVWTLADGTTVNGATETCTSVPWDCLYDVGSQAAN